MKTIKESWNSKLTFVSCILIFGMFIFSLGINQAFSVKQRLNYNQVISGFYNVLTQFCFLFLGFLANYCIQKNYTEKTSIFYKSIQVNSFKYVVKEQLSLFLSMSITTILILLSISIFFNKFNNLLLVMFFASAAIYNLIVICSIISLIFNNQMLSIGIILTYWIFSVISAQTFLSNLPFIAMFDQQQYLSKFLNKTILYGTQFPMTIIIHTSIYLLVITLLNLIISSSVNKRWLQYGY